VGDKLIALGWHRINKKYDLPISVTAKIRYRQTVQKAKLLAFDQTSLEVVFEEEQWAIAPGQVVVAYIGDECIGS
jgi:tRNA-specific 2-thiouridylase